MKTTQKAIRAEIEAGRAIDLTTTPSNEVLSLRKAEHGFKTIATSCGTYGLTGCIIEGYETGRRYAVRSRSSNLYIVL